MTSILSGVSDDASVPGDGGMDRWGGGEKFGCTTRDMFRTVIGTMMIIIILTC